MQTNKGGTGFRSEAKSKIGDYIRGKISAQSLMHPSRINTKPIDKRQFALNAPASLSYNNFIKPEYQRKARRPPLKDYIEGKVKLSDMISPSRITHIPKERKYQPELKGFNIMADDSFGRGRSMESSERIVNHHHHNNHIPNSRQTSMKSATSEWSITSSQPATNLHETNSKTELTLVPIKTLNTHTGSQRRRKIMCKIKKIQRTGNSGTGGEEITEERIIEIPESLLREKQNVPKFLMDRYNIPCQVAGRKAIVNKPKRPLAIENCMEMNDEKEDEDETETSEVLKIQTNDDEITQEQSLVPHTTVLTENDCEGEGEGENSLVVDMKESRKTSRENANLPTEQGDYNSTTYIFEFYEETIPSVSKSAIIEEIDDDVGHRTDQSDKHNESFGHDIPQATYEDYKSQIYLQRELLDLHRSMLKCDKNVMVVEHSVNQVAANLNMIESVQNQEIRPVVMNMKNEHDNIKTQLEALQVQNEQLRTTVKCLRKKTTDSEKLMHFISENSSIRLQELEEKLQTITQAQVKSIEMQNVVNKNIFKMTNQIKRTYSEMDSSRHCASSIVKSRKNSNSSVNIL